MTCDFLARANSGVQALHPYVPGKPVDELERELGIRNIVKLASNENPLGPSPKVIEAIQAALPELTRYPDGNGYILKKALADTFALPLNSLTLGNGSNDVLELLARAFAGPGDEVVYSQHAFAVYPISTQAVGAKGVQVPAKNWGHDLPAMLAAITPATKLVFVANPNNPTGTWLTRTELESFLAEVPEQVLVVLDEAYTEYVQHPDFPNGLELVQRYPNLVVTRTFSKAYGLASLRVGYAVSHPQVADILNRVRQPFNVDSLALAAAVAALADKDYLAKGVALNTAGMQQFEQGFAKLGLDHIPSVGNFVCVNVGKEAAPVYQALLREGVIVRPVANYGMPTYLRISIGLPEENQRCLDALAKVLADA
ncbi:histidinol-phosphate transaminase [Balneatrix alpica]|uniref:histidinol-phosphate transaminase n=1 Tax=Balneatrix alpica TaxID=75684 RepID=UPI0027384DCC|nr:histidinol-phosphate transaminase [Balneatrix alpica]